VEKISVIIPVYKVEQYLRKCVDSVINQSYENLEIILVDDGSPDKCPSICDEYAKKDKRIKAIHKQNGGLSDARNAGLDIATGDYVMFVDSDDWVEPGIIKECLDALKKEGSDAVVTMFYNTVKGAEAKITGEGDKGAVETFDPAGALVEAMFKKRRLAAWGNLYKTELFEGKRFKKGYIYEDLELIPRLLLGAKKVTLYYAPLYNYLVREGSIMTAGNAAVSAQMVEIAQSNLEYFEKNVADKDAAEKLSLGVLFLIMSWYEEAAIFSRAKSNSADFTRSAAQFLRSRQGFVAASRAIGLKRKIHYLVSTVLPVFLARVILAAVYGNRRPNG
jgi:glycosyltransferase involved in cell wall biosynthesis